MNAVKDAKLAGPKAYLKKEASVARYDTVLLIIGLFAIWWLLALFVGTAVLPSPWQTLGQLWHIMTRGDFGVHVWESARAFGAALFIALTGGLFTGIVLGTHKRAGEVAEPVLVALYSIPKITLYPVILLLFGLGMSAKVAFGVIHGIIPVIIFTMNGIRNIPPVYFRAAQTMHLGRWQTSRYVVFPAVLPEIVSGFRFGFALTLLGTLIGEMFASQRGVGYELIRAMENNDVRSVMAWALLLVTAATLVSTLLLKADKALQRKSS